MLAACGLLGLPTVSSIGFKMKHSGWLVEADRRSAAKLLGNGLDLRSLPGELVFAQLFQAVAEATL
jgi:hypothetical protein